MIDEGTDEILGVVCLGMESSAETEDRDLLKPTNDFVPENMNVEFVSAFIGKVHDHVVTLPRKHQRESGTGKSKYYCKFLSYLKHSPVVQALSGDNMVPLFSVFIFICFFGMTDIISASNVGRSPKTPKERIRNEAHSALLSDRRFSWNSNISEFLSSGSCFV